MLNCTIIILFKMNMSKILSIKVQHDLENFITTAKVDDTTIKNLWKVTKLLAPMNCQVDSLFKSFFVKPGFHVFNTLNESSISGKLALTIR